MTMVRLHHLAGVTGFSARPGFCRRGARVWFEHHGLDWHAFRHGGIDSAQLAATGDPMALALVAHAVATEAHDGQS